MCYLQRAQFCPSISLFRYPVERPQMLACHTDLPQQYRLLIAGYRICVIKINSSANEGHLNES